MFSEVIVALIGVATGSILTYIGAKFTNTNQRKFEAGAAVVKSISEIKYLCSLSRIHNDRKVYDVVSESIGKQHGLFIVYCQFLSKSNAAKAREVWQEYADINNRHKDKFKEEGLCTSIRSEEEIRKEISHKIQNLVNIIELK